MKTIQQDFIVLPGFDERTVRKVGDIVSVYDLMRALGINRPSHILKRVIECRPMAKGLIAQTLFLGQVDPAKAVELKDWILLGQYIQEIAPGVSVKTLNTLNADLGIISVDEKTQTLPPKLTGSSPKYVSVTDYGKKPEIVGGKLSFPELDDAKIRTDGNVFSIFDFLKIVAKKKNPRDSWNRVTTNHPEVVGFCDNFKFPGSGQRETPVTDRKGIIEIAQLLPGEFGAKFRSEAAKIILAYLDADISLADAVVDNAIARGKAKDVEQHAARTQGILLRNKFTSVLSQHGVTREGYRLVTNAVYVGLMGKPAPELRKDMGLAVGENVRPHLSPDQWMSLGTVESAVSAQLALKKAWGNEQCAAIAHAVALQIGQLTGLAA